MRNLLCRRVAPFLTLLLLQPAAAQEPELRSRIAVDEDIRELLTDKTVHGIYADGNKWLEYHSPGGISAYWDGCTHPGEWWVADGLICYRYPGDPAQADHCWFVYRDSERIEFVYYADGPGGPIGAYSLDITAGNSEHLPLGTSDCLSAGARTPKDLDLE